MKTILRTASRLRLLSAALLFAASSVDAAERRDTVELGEVEVTGRRAAVRRLADGDMLLDADAVRRGARVLGEADVLQSLRRLPGVSAVSDFGSGVVVNGASPSETLFRIDGAPVFFPYRFGGVFSALNTSHFRASRFSTAAHPASFPSRTGGSVALLTSDAVPEKAEGYLSLGLIASSATVRLPVSDRFSIDASARVSYLDEIYGRFLDWDGYNARYRFHDYNVTLLWIPASSDRVTVNLFCGNDRLNLDMNEYDMRLGMRWNNSLASCSWRHTGAVESEVSVWYSGFSNRMELRMTELGVRIPSGIGQSGISAKVTSPRFSERAGHLSGGAELTADRVTPQYTVLSGFDDITLPKPLRRTAVEARLFADWHADPAERLHTDAGFSGSLYHCGKGYTVFSPSPRVTLRLATAAGQLHLHYGYYTQYLHQTGFSDIGLASNFWSASTSALPPMRSNTLSLRWSKKILDDRLALEAEVYGRLMRGIAEYDGDILSMLDPGYEATSNISSSRGHAYGVNLSASVETGSLSGSIAYSWGTVRRSHHDRDIYSILDPGHTLNANVAWHIGRHWTLNATFTLASGRRYTPVRSLFMIASNILCRYGEPNSARFDTNHRLDLSATYAFRTRGRLPLGHFINISLLNAYGHRNQESLRFAIDWKEGVIRRVPVYSVYRFIPSLSYAVEF